MSETKTDNSKYVCDEKNDPPPTPVFCGSSPDSEYVCNGDVCTLRLSENGDSNPVVSQTTDNEKHNVLPEDVANTPKFGFDQLFSQLFNNVLKYENKDGSAPNSLSQLLNFMPKKQEQDDEGDDDEGDDDEGDDDDDDDEGDDDEGDDDDDDDEGDDDEGDEKDTCNHLECSSDQRWDVLNKLLESHVILTRAVSSLLKTD
jgi:hypothetical protein